MKNKNLKFASRAVHVGHEPESSTGSIIPPIYATSTYVQESPGQHKGYEYSRTQNPTRGGLERCVADLENGLAGFAFSSGLAATSTLLDLLPAGSHVIACDDLYGGTYRLFERVRKVSANLEVTYLDLSSGNLKDSLQKALRPNTRMLWVETPTNPLLKIIDLESAANFALERELISVCDNTFASPYIQRPLELGFKISLHSTTKYINGHSDIIGGIIVTSDQELAKKIGFLQNAVGAIASPFDSFLAARGVKTLALRMERHSENAFAIAEFLESHPKIEMVFYPGLPSHPQFELAKRQMSLAGGMLSFKFKGNLKETIKFLEGVSLFSLAESLGGIESLINHPALMTHASIPADLRNKLGITDNLVRLSVGIEDKQDLINDLKEALEK
ncbi:MAG TPA: PLP-dependent aspartate aminotransferase family protein [Oligoflexia bacterium]|nr:PLP-dependent aspartate aminotransferase family protein [Oligoflexia bacterium]HMP27252.1 PLP-dependent aspartate aminotransferase family protein [Oligoflexia bacterium]